MSKRSLRLLLQRKSKKSPTALAKGRKENEVLLEELKQQQANERVRNWDIFVKRNKEIEANAKEAQNKIKIAHEKQKQQNEKRRNTKREGFKNRGPQKAIDLGGLSLKDNIELWHKLKQDLSNLNMNQFPIDKVSSRRRNYDLKMKDTYLNEIMGTEPSVYNTDFDVEVIMKRFSDVLYRVKHNFNMRSNDDSFDEIIGELYPEGAPDEHVSGYKPYFYRSRRSSNGSFNGKFDGPYNIKRSSFNKRFNGPYKTRNDSFNGGNLKLLKRNNKTQKKTQ